jgi:hypothetical protein
LYVGDNVEESTLLSNIIKVHFKKVQLAVAESNEQLIDILSYEGPFGFCIIDCSNKGLIPDDVYSTISGFIGERPCLFVGSPSSIKDRVDQDVYQRLEENDTLLRPIDKDLNVLISKLQICLKWAKEQEYEQSIVEVDRSEFLNMKIRSFYLYDEFPYDIYVEITSTKFIKAIAKNTKYTQGDIQKYVKQRVKHFYIKKDEQLDFLEQTIQKCSMQIQTLPNGIELTKTHIISFSVLQSYVSNFGVTQTVQELIELLIDSIPESCKDKQLTEIINDFPFSNGGVAVKGVFVAYVCDQLLRAMEWNARSSKGKMIIASILHDAFIDNDDLSKITQLDDEAFTSLSLDDQESFIAHPRKAAEMAGQLSGHSDIGFIIMQHHELPSGEGFPHGWSSIKLTILSCIFILSYNFSNISCDLELNSKNLKRIIRYLAKTYNVGNFKDPMKILAKLLNISI